jgi:hypothetical protein
MASFQDGPQQDAKQETIILEMNMIHNEEPGMEEQGRRYDAMG